MSQADATAISFQVNDTAVSSYIGANFCGLCHTSSTGILAVYNGWNTTNHSNAFNRKFLPAILKAGGNDSSAKACIPCHTVGFNRGGYIDYNTTPYLTNIQCENCHGAGSRHEVEVNLSSRVCGECHTGERRPTIDEWESSGHARSLDRIKGRNATVYSRCLVCHSADYRLSKDRASIPDATNTTQYGVTCAVCHDSHSKSNESQLRTVNATQTCAQCHFNYDNRAPGSSRPPHNFQVEMRGGRGGINVASIQFMPEVGCEDCHMFTRPYATGQPAITGHTFEANTTACKECHVEVTNQEGKDGNNTSVRHTQLGLIRSGRTECVTCHEKGFGARGYLDTWQSRVSDKINATQANVTLAKSAATTGELKDLYNKSKFNLDIVNVSDKTRGAHNPDYALALLREANRIANEVISSAAPSPTPTPIKTPAPGAGSISGYKINDANGNGKWDTGEEGVSGWTIKLIGITGTGIDTRSISEEAVTDARGFYRFGNLMAGEYSIIETMQGGWVPAGPIVLSIRLATGEDSMDNNFTNKQVVLAGTPPPIQAPVSNQ